MPSVCMLAFLSCCLITIWAGYTLQANGSNGLVTKAGFGLGVSHVFNLHPTFMVYGFVGLNFMAVSTFHYLSDSSYSQMAKKKIHMGLQTVALVFGLLGLIAVFHFHNSASPPIQNMYSMHSWLGLSTYLLFALQYVIGLTAFFYPRAREAVRRRLMPKHRFSGIVLVVAIVATIISGIQEKLSFLGTCNVVPEAGRAGAKTGHSTYDCMFAELIGLFIFGFAVFVLYRIVPINRKDQMHDVIDSRLELEEFEGLTMSIE